MIIDVHEAEDLKWQRYLGKIDIYKELKLTFEYLFEQDLMASNFVKVIVPAKNEKINDYKC